MWTIHSGLATSEPHTHTCCCPPAARPAAGHAAIDKAPAYPCELAGPPRMRQAAPRAAAQSRRRGRRSCWGASSGTSHVRLRIPWFTMKGDQGQRSRPSFLTPELGIDQSHRQSDYVPGGLFWPRSLQADDAPHPFRNRWVGLLQFRYNSCGCINRQKMQDALMLKESARCGLTSEPGDQVGSLYWPFGQSRVRGLRLDLRSRVMD